MLEKTLAELAEIVNGELLGESSVKIFGFNDVERAKPGEITFVVKDEFTGHLNTSKASAVIVPYGIDDPVLPAIRVKNPYLAGAIIHNLFYEKPRPAVGVHPSAQAGKDCLIASSACLAALCAVGDRVKIGKNVVIEAGVVIGDDVEIGDDSIVESNAVVRSGCKLGQRVILYSGAVIGSDGYGYATDSMGRHFKRPQIGNVVLEDDVEIGANSCIDRATFGTTLIKKGTKIDNLVQVAHNVEIGEDCLLVSQVGVAGSSKLGNGVILAGQAAVKDHVVVGDRVTAAGRTGINSNVEAGMTVAGLPAIPYKEWLRAAAAFSRLPQLVKDVRRLIKQVEELSERNERRKK